MDVLYSGIINSIIYMLQNVDSENMVMTAFNGLVYNKCLQFLVKNISIEKLDLLITQVCLIFSLPEITEFNNNVKNEYINYINSVSQNNTEYNRFIHLKKTYLKALDFINTDNKYYFNEFKKYIDSKSDKEIALLSIKIVKFIINLLTKCRELLMIRKNAGASVVDYDATVDDMSESFDHDEWYDITENEQREAIQTEQTKMMKDLTRIKNKTDDILSRSLNYKLFKDIISPDEKRILEKNIKEGVNETNTLIRKSNNENGLNDNEVVYEDYINGKFFDNISINDFNNGEFESKDVVNKMSDNDSDSGSGIVVDNQRDDNSVLDYGVWNDVPSVNSSPTLSIKSNTSLSSLSNSQKSGGKKTQKIKYKIKTYNHKTQKKYKCKTKKKTNKYFAKTID